MARDKWLRWAGSRPAITTSPNRFPRPTSSSAQVDTLVMTNACVHRAERVAFLMLLSEEFPNFVRSTRRPRRSRRTARRWPTKRASSSPAASPRLADKYFPWLVNLMSPAYWIYLAMAATILLNALGAYSRFRLWRIDANRGLFEARLRALAYPGLSEDQIKARAHSGLTREQIKALPPEAVIQTPQDRKAAEDLMKDFERFAAAARSNSVSTSRRWARRCTTDIRRG